MAGSLNKVILIGNVGQDPIIHTLPDGNKVARLSVCTNEKWTSKKTNEKVTEIEWHKIVVFVPALTSYIESYVKKGCQVYIEGILKKKPYVKDGIEKIVPEIHIKGFNHFLIVLNFAKTDNNQDNQQIDSYDMDDSIEF